MTERRKAKPVTLPRNFPPSAATWTEALAGYRFLRDGRGDLPARDIERAERQLRDEAKALRDIARQAETLTLAAIKRRLEALGLGDDALIQSALLPATALAKHDRGGATSFRDLARTLAGAADYLRDGMAVYRLWVERAHGGKTTGRDPNMALEWLLAATRRLGISDPDVARRLAVEDIFPKGPGTDEPDLQERWMAVIRTARGRSRRK